MQINLTAAAIKSFENKLSKENKAYVRVGVLANGCSGFTYAIRLEDNKKEKDIEFAFGKITVIIDNKSILFLDGCSIDWENNIKGQKFVFTNPNSDKSCGCGKSFSINKGNK